MKETITRPKCPTCGKPMIFSFCIAYNEYVCIPCGKSVPFFNGLEEITTTRKEEKKTKKKYENDINRLAFIQGHATCSKCNEPGGNNCPVCKIESEFKYWGKGVEQE